MKKTTIILIILFLLFSFSSCIISNPDSGSIQEDTAINETEEDMPGTEMSEGGIDNSSDDSTETIPPGTEIEENIDDETDVEYNLYERLQQYPTSAPDLGEINEDAWKRWSQKQSEMENTEDNPVISPIQIMSEEEALEITGGKLVKIKEYSQIVGQQRVYGYLTPSGKLVYIDQFALDRLNGMSDFDVAWGLYEHNEFNIRTDYRQAEEGTVSVLASVSDDTDIRYTLYVEFYAEEREDLFGPQCYAILSSGTIVFDLGLTIENIEYDGLDVTYTVKQIDPASNNTTDADILTAKTGQTVYIDNICREYPFDDDCEWQITAEIINQNDIIVYTESFTVYESYEPAENTFFVTKGEKCIR